MVWRVGRSGPSPLGLALLVATAAAGATTAKAELTKARELVFPALVNITVVSEAFSDGRTLRFPGAGSGVVVTAEGHVLTNYHVAGNATRIECTMTDGEVVRAGVVAHDPLTDLSVLQLEGPGPFPWAELGDSDGLAVGDPVIALGNPLALSSSLTVGVVSNPARVFTDATGSELDEMELEDGEPTGLFTRWIQHDALILPGNSGGPLVDFEGLVVGINELGGSGMGFAIPANVARSVLEEVLATGRVERGWIGVGLQPVGRLGRATGVLVSSVLRDSPADEAGLEAGDILRSVAGRAVDARFFEEVPIVYRRLAELETGVPGRILVERDGRTLELEVSPEVMQPSRGRVGEIRGLGVTLQEVTPPMALVRGLPEGGGLLVTGIRPGKAVDSAEPQVAPWDLLVALDGTVLTDLASVEELAAREKDGPRLLRLWRQGEEVLAVIPAEGGARRSWGGELPKAWLGCRTQVLTRPLAEALALGDTQGFRVTQVFEGTEVARAGVRVGDVVTALEGRPLEVFRHQQEGELRRAVEELTVGSTARLSILRGGSALELEVRLEQRPAEAEDGDRYRHPVLEMSVRALTFHDRVRLGWEPSVDGVLVVEVTRGGWAQMAGLRLDDLLLSVNDEPVTTPDDVETTLTALEAAGVSPVVLFVRRGHRTQFVFVEPDWHEGGDS